MNLNSIFLFLINLFALIVINQTKSESSYSIEREILDDMNKLVQVNLNLLDELEKEKIIFKNFEYMIESNKKCLREVEFEIEKEKEYTIDPSRINPKPNCLSAIKLSNKDKNLQIYEYFKVELDNDERILEISFINLNKFNLKFDKIANFTLNFDERFLILIFTNKSIKISNKNGKILSNYQLNYFNINIIAADFSLFEEDNSVIILSDKLEISYFIIDINIGINESKLTNKLDQFDIEIFIPTRKSITINHNDKITFFKQHRLHGHKYIITSFENGSILVMNKDLEMKSNIILKKKIEGLYLHNGIMGVINYNSVIFLNILGGNSVLLKCSYYYNILKIEYDFNNNFLFLLDDEFNLIITNIKLSISKHNSNECNSIFKIKLADVFAKNDPLLDMSEAKYILSKMEIIRNILYIIIDKYMVILDINSINEYGILLNEFIIYGGELETAKEIRYEHRIRDHIKINFLTFPNLITSSNFILLNHHDKVIIANLTNSKVFKKEPDSNLIVNSNKNKDYIPSHNSPDNYTYIINLFFNNYLFKTMNNNVLYVYIIVIVLMSFVIIFYKIQKKREGDLKMKNKKITYKDEQEELQEIINKMPELKGKFDEIFNKSKKKNIKLNDSNINFDEKLEKQVELDESDDGSIEDEEEIEDNEDSEEVENEISEKKNN